MHSATPVMLGKDISMCLRGAVEHHTTAAEEADFPHFPIDGTVRKSTPTDR